MLGARCEFADTSLSDTPLVISLTKKHANLGARFGSRFEQSIVTVWYDNDSNLDKCVKRIDLKYFAPVHACRRDLTGNESVQLRHTLRATDDKQHLLKLLTGVAKKVNHYRRDHILRTTILCIKPTARHPKENNSDKTMRN
jgi:hypothetical protein